MAPQADRASRHTTYLFLRDTISSRFCTVHSQPEESALT